MTDSPDLSEAVRVTCPDGNCTGAIGENGRCGYCRRSPEEIRFENKNKNFQPKIINHHWGFSFFYLLGKSVGRVGWKWAVGGIFIFILIIRLFQFNNYQQKNTTSNTIIKETKSEPAPKTPEQIRTEIIAKGFSVWDGSHNELERYIKESMNDPDSYKHVETKYIDKGDFLLVQTTFRGKNAFGGTVKNSVTARAGLDGNLIEIITQGQ